MTKRMLIVPAVALAFCTGMSAEPADSLAPKKSRLTLGGYGEAVMSRNFYSQHFNRYIDPATYSSAESHGRFDLPHVTFYIGYDFGNGWTLGSEIEFEHGGTESAVEVEADEAGEYEAEVEKGGEVALEQFWINKEFFGGAFNIMAGEIIIPVGEINMYHTPDTFFSVYRSEGEAKMLPNTWHQTGISLWGKPLSWLRYEAIFTSGLDAERFGHDCFVHYGATSPYEYKIANVYAGAGRLDFYPVKGLRLSASGYVGATAKNTEAAVGYAYKDGEDGLLTIGSAGLSLDKWGLVVRANATYAYLSDASRITAINNRYPKHNSQDGSPSKHSAVAESAYSVGAEVGYNVFGLIDALKSRQKLYLFGRYEDYNTYASGTQASAYTYDRVKRLSGGINYMPHEGIIIKAEYAHRFLPSSFNDEPSFNIGIMYSGWFLR